MIPDKKTVLPADTRRVLSLTAGDIAAKKGMAGCLVLQYAYRDGMLETAEGTDAVEFGSAVRYLYATQEHILGPAPSGERYAVYDFTQQTVSELEGNPHAFVQFRKQGAESALYAVTDSALYRQSGSVWEKIAPVGGDALAVCHERFFCGKGNILSYSEPLAPETWTSGRTGSLELSWEGGDIIALIPFRDALYVFREREIVKLTAPAWDADFSALRLDFEGNILKGSVCSCGNYIAFCTQEGVWAVDADRAELVLPKPDGAFYLASNGSASCDGKYYAPFMTLQRGNCLLVYDREAKSYHWVAASAACIAGNASGVYFKSGGANYKLTKQGLPCYSRLGGEIVFQMRIAQQGKVRLYGGRLYGSGDFRVSCRSGKEEAEIGGIGSSSFRLPHTVTGDLFEVEIASSKISRLYGLRLDYREGRI